MASPKRGESVSVPCRACGKSFLKVTMVEGSHPLKCPQCGRTTTAKVKFRGEACVVTTEAAPNGTGGPPGPN
jgi:hypothetical protein